MQMRKMRNYLQMQKTQIINKIWLMRYSIGSTCRSASQGRADRYFASAARLNELLTVARHIER